MNETASVEAEMDPIKVLQALTVRIAQLPDGSDPAELAQEKLEIMQALLRVSRRLAADRSR